MLVADPVQAKLVVEGWHLHATLGLKHPDHHVRGPKLLPAPKLLSVRPCII